MMMIISRREEVRLSLPQTDKDMNTQTVGRYGQEGELIPKTSLSRSRDGLKESVCQESVRSKWGYDDKESLFNDADQMNIHM
mmetsp:Transcript_39758/g.58506  ORF Transcript_39758/g.58506 Transcript_39758/m.58506 type:complete len:82 (-) Transcript_39758:30-275(-)